MLLTEVHRHALTSPVYRLATQVRQGQIPTFPRFKFHDDPEIVDADVVLVGTNATRRSFNRILRQYRGIKSELPVVGDRVVGLRNHYDVGVLNGSIWTVVEVNRFDPQLRLVLADDTATYTAVTTLIECFQNYDLRPADLTRDVVPFDYAYALTAHKAQGSEWSRVCVVDESAGNGFRWIGDNSGIPRAEFHGRWLYTTITRASKRVDVVRP